AEVGIRDGHVTGVQTCALPIFDDGIWKALPADFDQTSRAANAFRRAGLVLMFPTLRGGNDNPGLKEGFFGEVDDVLAGAEYLAKIGRAACRERGLRSGRWA